MTSKIFPTTVRAIKSGEPELLEFVDLAPNDSTLILESLFDPINHFEERKFTFSAPDHHLRVVMPSYLHEAARGLAREAMCCPPRARNTRRDFLCAYKYYRSYQLHRTRLPLCHPGAERASTRPELVDDCRVWHEGSGGRVRIVILVKAYKPKPNAENQVRATLEISHARPGVAFTVTQMGVFPIPNPLLPDPAICWIAYRACG
ncbi:hypothetical protein HOY82DRAFT_626958 [Tuber indicum]|nr:hypothetical protein HOY82DRAFT_626958 [Tuber indicum]